MILLVVTATVLYVLGIAVVFGGTAAISFAAAPVTFRALPAASAGNVFGRILAVFDRMTTVASLVAILAAMALIFDRASPRSVGCAVAAMGVRVVVLVLRRSIAPRMAALKPPEPATATAGSVEASVPDAARTWDPEKRSEFDALHATYVRLYATNLFLSLLGLVLVALPA